MGIKKLSGQLRDSHDITHTVEAESLSEKPADHSLEKINTMKRKIYRDTSMNTQLEECRICLLRWRFRRLFILLQRLAIIALALGAYYFIR